MKVFQKFSQSRLGQWGVSHKKSAALIAGGGAVLLAGVITAIVLTVGYFHSILPQQAAFLGVSLGGMNVEQVEQAVGSQINSKFSDAALELCFADVSNEIKAADYGFRFEAEEVFRAAKACDYAKGQTPTPSIEYDAEKLSQTMTRLSEETTIAPVAYSYERQGDQLIVRAGQQGSRFDAQAEQKNVVNRFETLQFGEMAAQPVAFSDETVPIAIEEVHNQLARVMENASYSISDAGKLTYKDEQEGIDFDVEQAKQLISDPNAGEYVVPLSVTPPEVTVAQLRSQHDRSSCPSQLSTYTTKFSTRDANRNYNIAKAAAAINGTVLYPGEAFSALAEIGPASAAQGYKESDVYTPSGPSQGAGGGVCQVSTTAYLAALYGYMDITERHNHSYTVGYVPLGFDAAFSAGGTDLKFKNTRKDPVKVVASTTATSITVSIFGTPSDMDRYKVTMDSSTLQTIAPDTKQVPSTSLPAGQTRVQSAGQNGYVVNAHKVVTYNGVVVEEEDIPSHYKPITKTILVGTGAAQEDPSDPEQTEPEEP